MLGVLGGRIWEWKSHGYLQGPLSLSSVQPPAGVTMPSRCIFPLPQTKMQASLLLALSQLKYAAHL